MSLSTEDQPRQNDGRFSHKEGSAPEILLAAEKPVMAIGEKRPMMPGKTRLRAEKLGNTYSVDAKDFEDVFERANLLANQDKIRGVATRVEGNTLFDDGTSSYDYSVRLSYTNGPIVTEAVVDYGTGLGVTETPSVGDAMGALAETAQQAEKFDFDDVEGYAYEYGYEPDPGPHPLADAEAGLAFAHESRNVLIMLVGEERYADYVFGAEKAEHGYHGGVNWDAA